jgi:phage tail sheath gpL-like
MSNTNLTSGQVLPGFYGFVDYNAGGSGQAPGLRALLWGYIGSTAQKTPNQPFLPSSQQDANDGCERGSDLARMYAAAMSQPEAQGAEVWLMPVVAPSGGTASVYKLKTYVASTNPAKSGTIQLWIASQQVPAVGFTTSDTASTIASAISAAIATMSDLPIGTPSPTTDTVTLPYKHKGLTGEDLPIRCNISPSGTGVTLSPGQALFATSATGSGTVRIATGDLAVSTTIAGSDTAAAIATKVAAAFNADTYPLTAVVDGSVSAQVNLLFSNDRDVRRISAAVVTSTGTTVNLGSGATDGTGVITSLSYNGTQGVGVPSVSAALTNLASLDTFRSWASSWTDATTLGALATNIENASDGSINGQKQQHLTFSYSDAASVAGAIPLATSPNLTTSPPHYAGLWAPAAAIQNYEISARVAAARASLWLGTPQKNWNAFQIKGSSTVPILAPASKPSRDAQNTALRTYALAPVVLGASGNLEIVKGRTTSLAANKKLWAWSSEAQAAFHVVDLGLFFKERFEGGSIVQFSEPKAPGIFDQLSFKSATQERMRTWETNGNYDGADLLAPAVDVTLPDPQNPFRVNVEYPESPVLDLDQVVFTGHFTSPST